MSNSARRTLITYALVGEELERTNDFFLGLVPLFTIIAAENHGRVFDAKKFCLDLEKIFGLKIHEDVGDYLIPRLVKVGALERTTTSIEPKYIWTGPDTKEFPDAVESDIDQVIKSFSNFLDAVSPLTRASLGDAAIADLLLDAVLQHDRGIKEAENAISKAPSEPEIAANNSRRKRYSNEFDYYFFKFLEALKKSKDPLLDKISTIANAAIVSEALLELNAPASAQRPTNVDLIVFLDAPFAMDYLGLSGPDRQSYSSFIVKSLKDLGCRIALFQHYLVEIENNLKAMFSRQRHLRRGPTADALLKGLVSEEFVRSVMFDSEAAVRNAGLNTFDIATYFPPVNRPIQFDKEVEQALMSQLISRYQHPEALDRDLLAIQHVTNFRGGTSTSDLFRSKAILLTHNDMLAKVTNRFLSQLYQWPTSRFGPVIHQGKLYAMTWLVVGSQARQEMSRVQLIRNCARAVEYNPDIVERIRQKLSAISADKASQYDILISQPRYIKLSYDLSHGDPDQISEEKANQIFQSIKEDLVAEERTKSKVAIANERREKRELTEKIASRDEEANRLKNALEERNSLLRNLIELAVSKRRPRFIVIWHAIRIALFAFGVVVAALTLYVDLGPERADLKFLKAIIGFSTSLISMTLSLSGYGLGAIKRKVEESFHRSLEEQIIYDLKLPRAADYFAADLWTKEIQWKSELALPTCIEDKQPKLFGERND